MGDKKKPTTKRRKQKFECCPQCGWPGESEVVAKIYGQIIVRKRKVGRGTKLSGLVEVHDDPFAGRPKSEETR